MNGCDTIAATLHSSDHSAKVFLSSDISVGPLTSLVAKDIQ